MLTSWKVEKPVDFCTFREKLAKQMLLCFPKDRKHPGDEKFWTATQEPKKKRKLGNVSSERNSSAGSAATNTTTGTNLTRDNFVTNVKRLCGDLASLCRHASSAKPTDSSGRMCVVCGKCCYSFCSACGEAMCRYPTKKSTTTATPCFYHHHDTSFFGSSKQDASVSGTRVKDWTFPSAEQMANHQKDVLCLLQPRAIALPPRTPRPPAMARRQIAPAVRPTATSTAVVDTPQRDDMPPIDMDCVI